LGATVTVEGRDPTPEELVDRLEASKTRSPKRQERIMAQVVKDAEALDEEHRQAVVDWVFSQPQPPNPGPQPNDLLYPAGGGRPRYRADDLNTTIELRLTIDGKKYLCREMVDPMLWEMQLSDSEDRFTRYLEHFLHRSLGGLVTDSRVRGYFLSRVWVIRPGDPHDLQRCAHSCDPGHPDLWPRCLDGVILSELPGTSPIPGVGSGIRRDAVLGYCPCRCHRRDNYLYDSRLRIPGLAQFDEDRYEG
jgi:hypothetical protein